MWNRLARSAPRALPLSLLIAAAVFAQPSAAQVLLDPLTQPKFVNPVPNPLDPSFIWTPDGQIGGEDYYEIGAYQIEQQLGLVDPVTGTPLTTKVWGYGKSQAAATYPGRSFVVHSDQPIHVRWTNNLVDAEGDPLPHLLPVDPSVHWADPLHQGHVSGPYTGPVPIVTHIHGGHSEAASDGLPDYWFTPNFAIKGPKWTNEIYNYPNDQQSGTIWYHDHALGITRLNVYAGLAGFYIIRDENEESLNLPSGPYEIPLAIQDRMFTADGQLYYPSMPEVAGAPEPSVLPEFFGDCILVNGKAWPVLDVEPRKYRLRFLNGSDSRFYNLALTVGPSEGGAIPAGGPPVFWQIGTDSGLLDAPVPVTKLLLGCGERADVVIDFQGFEGMTLIVRNNAKSPYPNGATADPRTVGQIMMFRVGADPVVDDSTLPASLRPQPISPLTTALAPRQLILGEGTDTYGRLVPMLGTVADGMHMWEAPTTELPMFGSTEIWEVYNTTPDTHPIHLHLVSFQIIDRQRFRATIDPQTKALTNIKKLGKPMLPEANEAGWKDTARMNPGEVTRVIATFDRLGEYVWHCHILSHEDNEMMRRFEVVAPPESFTAMSRSDAAAARALQPVLEPVRPNPFNPRASVAFSLPAAGTAELAVYNLRGERVRVLVREQLPAGRHQFTWNGCDDGGRPVASGIYYARLFAAGVQETQAMALVR